MRSSLFLAVFLSLPLHAEKTKSQFEPPKIGSGPLLAFIHPEGPCNSQGRRQRPLYVLDPTGPIKPSKIWREYDQVPRLVERLSKNLLIMKHRQQLHLVDLARGRTEALLNNDDGRVYFPGDKKPIADVLRDDRVAVRDLAVSPDGKWAAYSDPRDDNVYLIDGANKKKTLLMRGWAQRRGKL